MILFKFFLDIYSTMDKKEKAIKIEELDVEGVAKLLEQWEMAEFMEFVMEKNIDGRKLLGVTEGIIKIWRPKANAEQLMKFITTLKKDPETYLSHLNKDVKTKKENNVEAQYQTVNVKKLRDQITSTSVGVEDILKKIVPPKSFLYRHQAQKREQNDKPVTSYTPMDAGTPKKPKRIFRLSSYEYPHFDVKQFRFSKQETFNQDRGYYTVKTNNRFYIQKTCKTESKTKYKSLTTAQEMEKYSEEHFYEDLNYNDMKNANTSQNLNETKEIKDSDAKPTKLKLQELFTSFKLPFFKKPEETVDVTKTEDQKADESEKDGHIYENSDSVANMYDSIHVGTQEDVAKRAHIPVEEYLEPVQLHKDYCDVAVRPKDDSILGYILSLFENFGVRRETTEITQEDDTEKVSSQNAPTDPLSSESKMVDERPRSKMADRPLPVPVENEPYFMDIGRCEAEDLLRGQPDGSFVLRPSTQPNHAYTLTVSCSNAVHNVGIRRRPDGRLALGFARRGERSFESITSLIRHHKKRRLLLVANGDMCGATVLNDTPQYYQTPSSLPVTKN